MYGSLSKFNSQPTFNIVSESTGISPKDTQKSFSKSKLAKQKLVILSPNEIQTPGVVEKLLEIKRAAGTASVMIKR